MTDDVFTETEGGTESALQALVGEGKKFADVEALAKGKTEADAHIATLEEEAATVKEEFETLKREKGTEYTVADLMETLKNANVKEGSKGDDKSMSNEELTEVIRSVLENETALSTRESNRARSNKLVLDKVEGNVEAAKALVAERAGALGMSPSKLAELSEEAPDAFAQLLDLKTTQSAPTTAGLPAVNSEALGGAAPVMEIDGYHTKAYFDMKRKDMGNLKYIHDTALQKELQIASQKLGARFNQ